MAKNKKKKSKAKKLTPMQKLSKRIEQNTTEASETAHKIWLAGVGAYGMAYDNAAKGAKDFNAQTATLFEDLVERGSEIEDDVRDRLSANPTFSKMSDQVTEAFENARDAQDEARERFEHRMEQMRETLGLADMETVSKTLNKRLEQLEDQVAEFSSRVKKNADKSVFHGRLARLIEEIESLRERAEEAPRKAAKKAAKAVAKEIAKEVKPRTSKRVKKVVAKGASKADDLTVINGLGPSMARKLKANGISTFAELANLTKSEAAKLDDKIVARGRVLRNNWIKQAKALA